LSTAAERLPWERAMSHADTISLLKEALSFLNDHPNLKRRASPQSTSVELAARITAYLKLVDIPDRQHPAVGIAIDQWDGDNIVWIDENETEISEGDIGIWVRAWVLVDHEDLPPDAPPSATAAIDPIAYRSAFEELPSRTRTIFRLHRLDGLDYGQIAARLSISVDEVSRHISDAIYHLSCRLQD
jgi:hypothetical protein